MTGWTPEKKSSSRRVSSIREKKEKKEEPDWRKTKTMIILLSKSGGKKQQIRTRDHGGLKIKRCAPRAEWTEGRDADRENRSALRR